MNWLGYMLVMHGPWRLTCCADNLIGRWCLRRAAGWAYRSSPSTEGGNG